MTSRVNRLYHVAPLMLTGVTIKGTGIEHLVHNLVAAPHTCLKPKDHAFKGLKPDAAHLQTAAPPCRRSAGTAPGPAGTGPHPCPSSAGIRRRQRISKERRRNPDASKIAAGQKTAPGPAGAGPHTRPTSAGARRQQCAKGARSKSQLN